MQFIRFTTNQQPHQPRLGALINDQVAEIIIPSEYAIGFPGDMAGLIKLLSDNKMDLGAISKSISTDSSKLHQLSQVKLLAPIIPSTILCSGSNYHSHNKEKANAPLSGKEPEFFVKTGDCVIGPNEGIIHDSLLTQKLDSETELAIVIGKPGRHIPVESALDHVFGYTIVNDVTARDRQVRFKPDGSTWYELGRGKAFDSSAPLGPCIVTADQIKDPQALHLRTRINGELRQSGNTRDMIWSCAELIHFFSINFTLRPGMVIITGTPAGTAWSSDKSLGGNWLPPEDGEEKIVPAKGYNLPGDIVESEIEGIGILMNRVI
jgi:2-keto-4-pentenoate hydratase/2-oxohepta-3-ene-1,7-dioic acid hydratase in catechol pathway